jgi:hypothetical protein
MDTTPTPEPELDELTGNMSLDPPASLTSLPEAQAAEISTARLGDVQERNTRRTPKLLAALLLTAAIGGAMAAALLRLQGAQPTKSSSALTSAPTASMDAPTNAIADTSPTLPASVAPSTPTPLPTASATQAPTAIPTATPPPLCTNWPTDPSQIHLLGSVIDHQWTDALGPAPTPRGPGGVYYFGTYGDTNTYEFAVTPGIDNRAVQVYWRGDAPITYSFQDASDTMRYFLPANAQTAAGYLAGDDGKGTA